LAGYILGQALSLYEGKDAVMTQSYGPEARGGASSTNVVVADEPIDYPFVQRPDILVALSQEAFDKFYPTVKSEGLILIDEELVEVTDQVETIQIPCTRLAESLGRRIVANVVMLGFFTGVTDVVSHDAVEQAITKSVKPKTLSLNLRAFEAGYQYALDKELAR
jgi:2-oxoglutarate ferredoxin oxidoreductase subunit gamma